LQILEGPVRARKQLEPHGKCPEDQLAGEGRTVVGGAVNPVLLYVVLVVFFATLIQSAFGFGQAIIAVPLLALRLPLQVATPLAVLVSITVASFVVAQDWREIHFRSAGWLVFSTLFGIPLGLAILTRVDDRIAKAALAVMIAAFSVYSLTGRTRLQLKSDSRLWLFGCGLCAGILGGAYGTNGPPLVVYGAMRRWSARHFRATLQGYFLPASLISMSGYWLAGLWVPPVTRYYLWSLSPMVGAILLGRAVNRRLAGEVFLKCAYIGLAGIGAALLIQALRG
jgi:uncharacterized protein